MNIINYISQYLPTMINQAELNLYLIITNRRLQILMLKPSTNDAVTSLKLQLALMLKKLCLFHLT